MVGVPGAYTGWGIEVVRLLPPFRIDEN